jgi:hypothetical protein
MKLHGHDPVSFDDVKNEIFDMVKPEDPLAITLQDLIQWYDYNHVTFNSSARILRFS